MVILIHGVLFRMISSPLATYSMAPNIVDKGPLSTIFEGTRQLSFLYRYVKSTRHLDQFESGCSTRFYVAFTLVVVAK